MERDIKKKKLKYYRIVLINKKKLFLNVGIRYSKED